MRFIFILSGLIIWTIFSPVTPAAIIVTEPDGLGDARIAEGVEFSAYEIGNRWDMSDAADVVAKESGYLENQEFVDGVFRATTFDIGGFSDPAFFLTYQGVSGSVVSMNNGQMYPIDTAKYRTLTMRIRHLGSNGTPTGISQPINVIFFKDENSYLESTFGYSDFISVPSDGNWHIVQFDLVDDLEASSEYAWSDFDTVKGLRVDPTPYSDIQIEVDWVRLTGPNSPGSEFSASWSGGVAPYEINAVLSNDETFLLAEAVNETSMSLDFSGLPGGDYRIEVADANESGQSAHPVHVNEAPILNFTQPDIAGDESKRFSLIEGGNPWGPMDAGDILDTANLANVGFDNPSGSLTADSTSGDPAIVLKTARQINTEVYRMLSYTLSVSGARDIGEGSVARVFWGDNLADLNTSEDIIVEEGLNRYQLGDLRDLPIEGGDTGLWQGTPFYFRIDPHEFQAPRSIRLDDVTLAPFDSASPDFLIEWVASDTDDEATISFYADLDRVPGNGNESLIAQGLPENPEDKSLLWNAASEVPDGTYHLYGVINDDLNQTLRYATGPLRVGQGNPISLSIIQPDGIEDNVIATKEFSREVRNNAWDMSNNDDVPLSKTFDVESQAISGGILSGTSSGDDPSFYLMYPGDIPGQNSSNGIEIPISTADYRFLTFKAKFQADSPIALQVLFMRDGTILPSTVGYTDFIEIFPGDWQVVTIDLEAATSSQSPYSWLDYSDIKGLRIDPATGPGVSWEFDWFTLTGSTNGSSQYPVTWTVTDPGNTPIRLSAIDQDGFRIPLIDAAEPETGFASISMARLPIGQYLIGIDTNPGPSIVSPGPINVVEENLRGEITNISTRAEVGQGDDVTIAGFIIGGQQAKQVLLRGRGPSLEPYIPSDAPVLGNPRLRLFTLSGSLLDENDDWKNSSKYQAIAESSLAPSNAFESAILTTLEPGLYTAILDQAEPVNGIGIVEVFDWDGGDSKLINLSTRARVGLNDNVTIAGFIIEGPDNRDVLIRGRGPSLIPHLPAGAITLTNPRLRLFNQQGVNFLSNDDWVSADNAAEISASGLAPESDKEAAILINLGPGPYTVFLESSDGGTGIGIVEILDQTE